MSKRAIITGGAGFVGSYLTEKLLEKGYEKITLIDNLVRTGTTRNIDHLLKYKRVQFLNNGIENFDFYFSGYYDPRKIDEVYHLAATRINRCVKFPKEGHRYITDGGFRVLQFCKDYNIKLFFASSASVYQRPQRLPIEETDLCMPRTLYGAGKLYTENLIQSFGIEHIIHRFFSVYGVRMDSEGAYTEVIFNWLNAIKNGERKLTVYGDPHEKIIDLVYVTDVVKAIDLTMENANNDTFNVSTETGVTLVELIKIISDVTGVDVEMKIVPENRTDIEKARIGDTSKLRSLGWEPKTSLENGIEKTWKWILGENYE